MRSFLVTEKVEDKPVKKFTRTRVEVIQLGNISPGQIVEAIYDGKKIYVSPVSSENNKEKNEQIPQVATHIRMPESKPMTTQFTCPNCHEIFLRKTTKEYLEKEKDKLFPGLNKNESSLVCHDCFIKLMDFNEPGQKRYL
jgi:hypothetical protein